MSEQTEQPGDGAVAARTVRWRDVWQAPALVLALICLVAAVYTAFRTRPAPDLDRLLSRAERMITDERCEDALEVLNGSVLPYVDRQGFRPEHRRRLHVLRARAIYVGQRSHQINRPENNESIVTEYLRGIEYNAALSPEDRGRLVDTYISLRRHEKASTAAAPLRESDARRWRELTKRMIAAKLAEPVLDFDWTIGRITELLSDPELPVTDRAWAIARQTELRYGMGFIEDGVAILLRLMPSVTQAPPAAMGELYALLGRGYLETGATADARKWLENAAQLLPSTDERMGGVLVMLGRIAEMNPETRAEARSLYEQVLNRYGASPAVLPALLGLGEVLSTEGSDDAALESYRRLVRELNASPFSRDVRPEDASASLIDRYRERISVPGGAEVALQYAQLAESVWGFDRAPPIVLQAVGEGSRHAAEQVLRAAGLGGDESYDAAVVRMEDADPVTRAQARRLYASAARYYREHANRVVLTDNEAFAESLWATADCYDRAGDLEAAVAAFAQYADDLPRDPRHPEARFRLAEAHRARGDFASAERFYQELIEESRLEIGRRNVGIWADASWVPLAKAYLEDESPVNDGDAEELLLSVVSGQRAAIESRDFEVALVQLGQLYYQQHRFTGQGPDGTDGAIARLTQATVLYPDHPEIDAVRFKLADSYRLEAAGIAQTLKEALPGEHTRRYEQLRQEYLREAVALFGAVRDALEAGRAGGLTKLQELYLRNAYFYLGECAFALADYDAAIAYYQAAKERYPRDPASLVAMTQIVSAYIEQGDYQRALTANERAMRFYRGLPPSAWEEPGLPMTQADWERWLDSTARLLELSGARGRTVDAGGSDS